MRENINIRTHHIFVVYNIVLNLLKFSELPKVVTWTTKLNFASIIHVSTNHKKSSSERTFLSQCISSMDCLLDVYNTLRRYFNVCFCFIVSLTLQQDHSASSVTFSSSLPTILGHCWLEQCGSPSIPASLLYSP